jgi:lysophospholipase L1-like esterase
VAILGIGGNSAAGGIDPAEQAEYASCIDKLIAKGYGKVLCRGILPNVAAQPLVDAANITLKSVMDGKADAKLVWIDPTTWAFSTDDGTHPNAAGYATLAGYAVPAYSAALGL